MKRRTITRAQWWALCRQLGLVEAWTIRSREGWGVS